LQNINLQGFYIVSSLKMILKTRIAPTPSGLLHQGNGVSFLLTYALTKAYNGQILLRIDDLDAERMRLEYLDDIFRTLDWLGIEWDEGPISVADFQQNWSQHHRLDLYQDMLEKLNYTEGTSRYSRERVVYPCNCSRKQIKEASTNGLYPQTCRFKHLNFDEKETAWRIHVPETTKVAFKNLDLETQKIHHTPFDIHHSVGDFVVRQKNGLPAYQVASLADDVHLGINFIVRGADLLPSTAAQIFLAEQLGRTQFTESLFMHHQLVTNALGEKLSKSQGASALAEWQKAGQTPERLIKQVAQWLHLPSIGNLNELMAVLKSLNYLKHPLSNFQ
jgi:glutamyl/glutaminyl-tRNA synthetase